MTLTLEDAMRILNIILIAARASEEEVVEEKMGTGPVAVAITGADGRLLSFAAMDGVAPMSIQLAQNKAYTAIIGNRSTSRWAEKSDLDSRNFTDDRFTCFAGGVVVFDVGATAAGAIGVSGRSASEDHELAAYGVRKFLEKQSAKRE